MDGNESMHLKNHVNHVYIYGDLIDQNGQKEVKKMDPTVMVFEIFGINAIKPPPPNQGKS